MALFCDGGISTTLDLTAQDSALLDVVATENIDLTQKLDLAQTELQVELESYLQRARTNYWYTSTVAGLTIQQIAITVPLKQWHTYRTLSVVYRDAYFTQLNERFQAKWRAFESLVRTAMAQLVETGIGLVHDPIVKAQLPLISLVPGIQPGGEFYFKASYVNASGEEGSPSSVTNVSVSDYSDPLIVPKGYPTNATAWNLYAGSTPESISLQNALPLPIGSPFVWLNRSAEGRAPGTGQRPNRLRPFPRVWQRS